MEEYITYKGIEYQLRKENKSDHFYWLESMEVIGGLLVTFDKVKVYNLFTDYPSKFSDEEAAIFKKECPYWHNFFT